MKSCYVSAGHRPLQGTTSGHGQQGRHQHAVQHALPRGGAGAQARSNRAPPRPPSSAAELLGQQRLGFNHDRAEVQLLLVTDHMDLLESSPLQAPESIRLLMKAVQAHVSQSSKASQAFLSPDRMERLLGLVQSMIQLSLQVSSSLGPQQLCDVLEAATLMLALRGPVTSAPRGSQAATAAVNRRREAISEVSNGLTLLLNQCLPGAVTGATCKQLLACLESLKALPRTVLPLDKEASFFQGLRDALQAPQDRFMRECDSEELMQAVSALHTPAGLTLVTRPVARLVQDAADRLGWGRPAKPVKKRLVVVGPEVKGHGSAPFRLVQDDWELVQLLTGKETRGRGHSPAEGRRSAAASPSPSSLLDSKDWYAGPEKTPSSSRPGLSASQSVDVACFFLALPQDVVDGRWLLLLTATTLAPATGELKTGPLMRLAASLLASPLLINTKPKLRQAFLTRLCTAMLAVQQGVTFAAFNNPLLPTVLDYIVEHGATLPDPTPPKELLSALCDHATQVVRQRAPANRSTAGKQDTTVLAAFKALQACAGGPSGTRRLSLQLSGGQRAASIKSSNRQSEASECVEALMEGWEGNAEWLVDRATMVELLVLPSLGKCANVPLGPELQAWVEAALEAAVRARHPDVQNTITLLNQVLLPLVSLQTAPVNPYTLDICLPALDDMVGKMAPGALASILDVVAPTKWIGGSLMRERLMAAAYGMLNRCGNVTILSSLVQAAGRLAQAPVSEDKCTRLEAIAYDALGMVHVPSPQEWGAAVSSLLELPAYSTADTGPQQRVRLLHALCIDLGAQLQPHTIMRLLPAVHASDPNVRLDSCRVDSLVRLLQLVRHMHAAPAADDWLLELLRCCGRAFLTQQDKVPNVGVLQASALQCLPALIDPHLGVIPGSWQEESLEDRQQAAALDCEMRGGVAGAQQSTTTVDALPRQEDQQQQQQEEQQEEGQQEQQGQQGRQQQQEQQEHLLDINSLLATPHPAPPAPAASSDYRGHTTQPALAALPQGVPGMQLLTGIVRSHMDGHAWSAVAVELAGPQSQEGWLSSTDVSALPCQRLQDLFPKGSEVTVLALSSPTPDTPARLSTRELEPWPGAMLTHPAQVMQQAAQTWAAKEALYMAWAVPQGQLGPVQTAAAAATPEHEAASETAAATAAAFIAGDVAASQAAVAIAAAAATAEDVAATVTAAAAAAASITDDVAATQAAAAAALHSPEGIEGPAATVQPAASGALDTLDTTPQQHSGEVVNEARRLASQLRPLLLSSRSLDSLAHKPIALITCANDLLRLGVDVPQTWLQDFETTTQGFLDEKTWSAKPRVLVQAVWAVQRLGHKPSWLWMSMAANALHPHLAGLAADSPADLARLLAALHTRLTDGRTDAATTASAGSLAAYTAAAIASMPHKQSDVAQVAIAVGKAWAACTAPGMHSATDMQVQVAGVHGLASMLSSAAQDSAQVSMHGGKAKSSVPSRAADKQALTPNPVWLERCCAALSHQMAATTAAADVIRVLQAFLAIQKQRQDDKPLRSISQFAHRHSRHLTHSIGPAAPGDGVTEPAPVRHALSSKRLRDVSPAVVRGLLGGMIDVGISLPEPLVASYLDTKQHEGFLAFHEQLLFVGRSRSPRPVEQLVALTLLEGQHLADTGQDQVLHVLDTIMSVLHGLLEEEDTHVAPTSQALLAASSAAVRSTLASCTPEQMRSPDVAAAFLSSCVLSTQLDQMQQAAQGVTASTDSSGSGHVLPQVSWPGTSAAVLTAVTAMSTGAGLRQDDGHSCLAALIMYTLVVPRPHSHTSQEVDVGWQHVPAATASAATPLEAERGGPGAGDGGSEQQAAASSLSSTPAPLPLQPAWPLVCEASWDMTAMDKVMRGDTAELTHTLLAALSQVLHYHVWQLGARSGAGGSLGASAPSTRWVTQLLRAVHLIPERRWQSEVLAQVVRSLAALQCLTTSRLAGVAGPGSDGGGGSGSRGKGKARRPPTADESLASGTAALEVVACHLWSHAGSGVAPLHTGGPGQPPHLWLLRVTGQLLNVPGFQPGLRLAALLREGPPASGLQLPDTQGAQAEEELLVALLLLSQYNMAWFSGQATHQLALRVLERDVLTPAALGQLITCMGRAGVQLPLNTAKVLLGRYVVRDSLLSRERMQLLQGLVRTAFSQHRAHGDVQQLEAAITDTQLTLLVGDYQQRAAVAKLNLDDAAKGELARCLLAVCLRTPGDPAAAHNVGTEWLADQSMPLPDWCSGGGSALSLSAASGWGAPRTPLDMQLVLDASHLPKGWSSEADAEGVAKHNPDGAEAVMLHRCTLIAHGVLQTLNHSRRSEAGSPLPLTLGLRYLAVHHAQLFKAAPRQPGSKTELPQLEAMEFVQAHAVLSLCKGDGDDLGSQANAMVSSCLAFHSAHLAPAGVFQSLELLYGTIIRAPPDRLGLVMHGGMCHCSPRGSAMFAFLSSATMKAWTRTDLAQDAVVALKRDAEQDSSGGCNWGFSPEQAAQIVERGLQALGSSCPPGEAVQAALHKDMKYDPKSMPLVAEMTKRALSMAYVGGGPYVAGQYDAVWRTALLYSIAAEVGLDCAVLRDRLLHEAQTALTGQVKPPVLAVMAWLNPLIHCRTSEYVDLPPDIPIRSWLAGADWSCLGEVVHPCQVVQLQGTWVTCPAMYQLFLEVMHDLHLQPDQPHVISESLAVLPPSVLLQLRSIQQAGESTTDREPAGGTTEEAATGSGAGPDEVGDSGDVGHEQQQPEVLDPKAPFPALRFTNVLYVWSSVCGSMSTVELSHVADMIRRGLTSDLGMDAPYKVAIAVMAMQLRHRESVGMLHKAAPDLLATAIMEAREEPHHLAATFPGFAMGGFTFGNNTPWKLRATSDSMFEIEVAGVRIGRAPHQHQRSKGFGT